MESIQSLIDKKLLEKEKRIRSGRINPSSFGRCFRYQIWNRQDLPPSNPPDIRVERVFAAGKLFHDFVQGLLPDHETEVKIETEDILAYADIVLPDEVVDLKSVHSRKFWYMDKNSYNIETENLPHILQVASYSLLLGKPRARLVYISKDDLCIREYGFFAEKWKEKVGGELYKLREYWNRQELPPKEPRAYGKDRTGKSKECSTYCCFRDKCKEGL